MVKPVIHAVSEFVMIPCDLQRTVNRDAQSKRKLLAQSKLPVTPPVAVSVELIVSLMSMEGRGEPPPDANSALMRRFPAAVISAAFSHLRLLDYVLHGVQDQGKGETGQRFRLSDGFHDVNRVICLASKSIQVVS